MSFRKLAGQSQCKLKPTTLLICFPVIELTYTVGELCKTILWIHWDHRVSELCIFNSKPTFVRTVCTQLLCGQWTI